MLAIRVGDAIELPADFGVCLRAGEGAFVRVSGMVVHPGVCAGSDIMNKVVITPLVSSSGDNLYWIETRGCTIADVVKCIKLSARRLLDMR